MTQGSKTNNNLKVNNFFGLEPDSILLSAELAGFRPTGRLTQLNSYENRVFEIELESETDSENQRASKIIAKFYRPGRWSLPCVLEEHQFLDDLITEGMPAVSPLQLADQQTVFEFQGLLASFFPKQMGKMPDELLDDHFVQIGRRLALLHNIGSGHDFMERPILGEEPEDLYQTLDLLKNWVGPELSHRYFEAAENIIHSWYEIADDIPYIRIHGDCHRGNLLLSPNQEFFFVDFDDCLMGPEIQDFWMLTSDDDGKQMQLLAKGYSELRRFPSEQIELIPYLRAIRIINYAAWIAKRWQDPSFPKIFPDFGTYNYWAEETEALEKISALIWSKER